MSVFSIGVFGILASFWEPVLGQNGGTGIEAFRFFSGSVAGPPFWLDTGGGYPIGPIPKWLDFGGFGPRFWRFWDFILGCFRHDLAPICSAMLVIFGCSFLKLPLVIGGLVGLREAQRICTTDCTAELLLELLRQAFRH